MRPQPSLTKPSSRRAARLRSRIVFFLLRRALRRLQRGAKAGAAGAISRLFGQGPREVLLIRVTSDK